MAGISGRVAEASRLGLEDLLARKLLKEKLEEQRQQQAIVNARAERELGQRDRELASRESEAVANRAERHADRATKEADRARLLDAEAGEQRTLGNMAGVIEMTGSGLDPQTAQREIAMTGLRGGVEPPRMLDKLIPVAQEPKRHLVTTPGPGGRPLRRLVSEDELTQGVTEYREPKEPKAPRAPTGQLSQRDIVSSMRQARRDAIAAYRAAAGPTGRVTDETGNVVDLDAFLEQYVDDYMGDIERLLSSDDAEDDTPGPRLRGVQPSATRPPAGGHPPSLLSSRGPAPPPTTGARPLTGPLRRVEDAARAQRPKVGDVVTLRDGRRVRVTGVDASGKLQGAPVQ